MQIPVGTEINTIGIYASSFEDSNSKAEFYVDSYAITDEALDTVRFLDLNDPAVRLSFESGTKNEYISAVQTNDWKQESNYTAVITANQKIHGKKSLLFKTSAGAAKAQYIYLNKDFFMPKNGQWINLKIYMTENSQSDKIAFFYKRNDGNLFYSDYYYFANDKEKSIMTDEIRKKGEWVTLSYQIPQNVEFNSIGLFITSFGESNDNAEFYLDNYSIASKPLDEIRYNVKKSNKEGMLIDFESGAASDYMYVVQDQKWHQAKGMTSAVTSYRAADGKRSLYVRNTSEETTGIYLYFPLQYNPKEGRFLNVKIFVEKGNKGLDYANLIYRQNNGTIVSGPKFYFANNEEGTIEKKKIYKQGEWITLSLYVPRNSDLNRAGLYFGCFGNNGYDKEIFIDSYCYTQEPLDTTNKYLIKPVIDVPESFSPGINRVQLTSTSLFNGITLTTADYIKTHMGSIKAENLSFEAENITSGSIFDKVSEFVGNRAFALYKLAMFSEKKEITLKEKIGITFTIPDNLDIKTAQVYYVDQDGNATLIESTSGFETRTINTDKLGYFMIMGDKFEAEKLTFLKVVKQIDTPESSGGILWWHWLIIVGGALIIAAAAFIILFIRKKKALK